MTIFDYANARENVTVCFYRQELNAVHAALLDCHERMARDRGPYEPMTDRHAATYDAFIQCDLILRGRSCRSAKVAKDAAEMILASNG